MGDLVAALLNLVDQVRHQDGLSSTRYTMDPKATVLSSQPANPFRGSQHPVACSSLIVFS